MTARSKRTKAYRRTLAVVESELAIARAREHALVESCSNDRPASIDAAWAAAAQVNTLLTERRALLDQMD